MSDESMRNNFEKLFDRQQEICERLKAVEMILSERKSVCEDKEEKLKELENRIRVLELHNSGWRTTLNFICWAVTALLAILQIR